jgi:CBS domain-containing protein
MILVKKLMNKKVITVGPDVALKKICQVLTRHKITGVPVVNSKKEIIGIVSERDIIAAVPKPNFSKKYAKDIMVKKVITVEDTASLSEVSQIFSSQPFRHIPVTRNGKIVGLITRNDTVKQMLGHYY